MSPTNPRTARVLTASAVLAVLAASGALLLQYGAGRDQGIYLAVARVMQRGGMPYENAWDFKPPGIFILYRLGVAFGGIVGLRALEALAVASQTLAFGIFTRRFAGSATPGLLGGAFAALLHARLEFWHTGQPESFGGPALAWAIVLATHPARPALSRLAAGVLFGFAALLKPPLGAGLVFAGAWLGLRESSAAPECRLRAATRPLVLMGAGAAACLAVTVLWLALGGAFPAFLETFRDFVPGYTALNLAQQDVTQLVWRAILEFLLGYSVLIPAGMLCLLAVPETALGRSGVALVAAVVVPQIAGVGLQAKFFGYHYGAALPFGALLGAWGLWRLWQRLDGAASRAAVAGGLGLLVHASTATPEPWLDRVASRAVAAVSSPSERDRMLDRLESAGNVDASANRAAAALVRQATPDGSFLFVWGFEPVLYEAAGRPPASRYLYDVPMRAVWFAPRARARLMADLARRPPAAVLVERGDTMPFVTGDRLDSEAALETFPELKALLATGYVAAADTGRFVLWLKRPPS